MPRRKAGHDGSSDEESSPVDQPAVKRRKRLDPVELCHTLYELIRNYKAADGRILCEPLIRAPSRRSAPEYYDVVQVPIDLIRIHQKLKNDEYSGLHQFTVDIELLFKNAKDYYMEDTAEYQDTLELEALFRRTKEKLVENNQNDPVTITNQYHENHSIFSSKPRFSLRKKRAPVPDSIDNPSDRVPLRNTLEDLFASFVNFTDGDGRKISEAFELLPSRKFLPLYYNVIKSPIDLKTIARKIENDDYTTVDDLEEDVLLMVKNACVFNEPKSQIYKDAKTLEKVFRKKRREVDQLTFPATNGALSNGAMPGIAGRRPLSRRAKQTVTNLASLASPGEESDDEEEDDEEEEEEDDESSEEESGGGSEASDEDSASDSEGTPNSSTPQLELFRAIVSKKIGPGNCLAQPFMKLPSKKLYPDYYQVIRTPLSLEMIEKKIQKCQYGNLSELAGDLNVLFENAKTYNRPDSRLYRHALKLQNLMQRKTRELLGYDGLLDQTHGDTSGVKGGAAVLKRKRMQELFSAVRNYTDDDGRELSMVFVEKPSKKLYPDYYEIIQEPIDLLTIEARISGNEYSSLEALADDLRLMFANCREYNEPGSVIFQDADILQRIMEQKLKELRGSGGRSSRDLKTSPSSGLGPSPPGGHGKKTGRREKDSWRIAMEELVSAVEDYTDRTGRQLSEVFFRLPTKEEYPDYYEVIRNPMDLERIRAKMNKYESLEACMSDIMLMLDNACKYNEPESQIYKDAIVLQQVALRKKIQLSRSPAGLPDVRLIMQDILLQLFIGMYNHCDAEGRCYCHSLVALPEYETTQDGTKERAPSFDSLKRLLDKGHYQRLDHFQRDLFAILRRARKISRTDSNAWEDSIELQRHYIKLRDELCCKVLLSPAFEYRDQELSDEVDTEKQVKLGEETAEAEQEGKELKQEMEAAGWQGDSCQFNQQTYSVGDYVYVEPRVKGMEPSIVLIEKLYRNEEEEMIFGQWFYRPNETYHMPSRKFLEKEVFPSDNHSSTPLRTVLGRCYVMFVRDYFKFQPEGFKDEDVYVCESRYLFKGKTFKKIVVWREPIGGGRVRLVPRPTPLLPIRVASIFSKVAEDKVKDELLDLDSSVNPFPEEELHNVPLDPQPPPEDPEDVRVFYEQLKIGTNQRVVRLGDFVYVRAEQDKRLIAQVERMWLQGDMAYFRGPWFVTKEELPPTPNIQLPAYKNTVLLSSIKDTNPLLAVVGKCMVYEASDFLSRRPTEIGDDDVYLCCHAYDEARRVIIPFMEGRRVLPLVTHSDGVLVDEIYLFVNPLTMEQFDELSSSASSATSSKQLERISNSVVIPSVAPDSPAAPSEASTDFGGPPPLIPAFKNKSLDSLTGASRFLTTTGRTVKRTSGYVIYAGEIRKSVIDKNPGMSFGEISKLVGLMWKRLPKDQQQVYENRAKIINKEVRKDSGQGPGTPEVSSAVDESESLLDESSLSAPPSPATPQVQVTEQSMMTDPTANHDPDFDPVLYDCGWSGCDWSFQEKDDLAGHLFDEARGHIWGEKYEGGDSAGDEGYLKCRWRSCTKTKRMIYFSSHLKLLRHVRETHMQHLRPRQAFLSRKIQRRPPPVSSPATSVLANGHLPSQDESHHHPSAYSHPLPNRISTSSPLPPPPSYDSYLRPLPPEYEPEPMFLSPPSVNQLLHSDAYITYIQGLGAQEKRSTLRDIPRELCATSSDLPARNPTDIPSHWLGNGIGTHKDQAAALWSLRDHMVMDSLKLTRHPPPGNNAS